MWKQTETPKIGLFHPFGSIFALHRPPGVSASRRRGCKRPNYKLAARDASAPKRLSAELAPHQLNGSEADRAGTDQPSLAFHSTAAVPSCSRPSPVARGMGEQARRSGALSHGAF